MGVLHRPTTRALSVRGSRLSADDGYDLALIIHSLVSILGHRSCVNQSVDHTLNPMQPHLVYDSLHLLCNRNGYALFGYIANAHVDRFYVALVTSMSEEAHNPSIQIPRAMVYSVPIATISGLVFLLPIVFTLPDIATLLAGTAQPLLCLDIFRTKDNIQKYPEDSPSGLCSP